MKRQEIINEIKNILDSETKADEIKSKINKYLDEITPKQPEKGERKIIKFKVNQVEVDEKQIKVPPQMKVLLSELKAYESSEITLDEMKELANNCAEDLKTKQDPFRILMFYRPRMIELGVLEKVS